MTFVGLDVHKCVIQAHVIADDGKRRDIRFDLTRETLIEFAQRELARASVVLEAIEVEDLMDLAKQFKQRTLYGIGFARRFKNS